MTELINLAVPFFTQRSNRERDTAGKTVAWDTCNLTSLCMILNYLGITDDTPDILIKKFLNQKYKDDDYTDWANLKNTCIDLYNIRKEVILLNSTYFKHERLFDFLDFGFPILFSFGVLKTKDPKTSGHIAVLRGMTASGDWILNDPWGDPVNAYGLLNSAGSVFGVYVARENRKDLTAGKGSGDNAILSRSEISKVCLDPPHSAMCILWAKQWCFFLRNSAGQRIRFGDKENTAVISEIQKSLKSHLNFILTDNGSIKKELSFSSATGRNIYSCGPGRIVAVRNTEDIKSNFVLVMHSLPGNSEKKIFMMYKGMEYINLNQKIREGIYNSENYNKSWYEQLIQKIHTKAVIYDTGHGAEGLAHKTGLSERGIAYLIPQVPNVKNFAENLELNKIPSYDECAAINDINNYKIQNQTRVSFKIKNPETGMVEIKNADSLNLIPQTVNLKEYRYYRSKLAQLLSGESVVFLGEDDNTISDIPQKRLSGKETFSDIFLSVLKDVFTGVEFEGNNYKKYLDKVIVYYQKKFNLLKESNNNPALKELGEDFERKCRILCRKLLETPWAEQTYAFSYNDKWYKGDKNGSFTGLKQVYENVYSLFQSVKSVYDFGTTWKKFEQSVKYYYPANIDFFIEATSGTVLGKATVFSSVKCFSTCNIFKNQNDMKVLTIENDYNKYSVVSALKEENYLTDEDFKLLSENYVKKSEIENFYEKYPVNDLNYILYASNPLKEISQKKQKKTADDAYGNMEISEDEREETLFSSLLSDELIMLLKKYYKEDFFSDRFYFFNPVKAISYLYDLHNEQIKNIGKK